MPKTNRPYYCLAFLLVPYLSQASVSCERAVAKMLSAQGKVDTQRADESDWIDVRQQDEFCPGDKVRTAKQSRATLRLSNESVVSLDQATTMLFPKPTSATPEWLVSLLNGSSFFRSRQPQELHIQTPFINAVHEGTEFLVHVDEQQTAITVFDGQVAAQNAAGNIHIKPGFTGIAAQGQTPRIQALLIKPEDAVQWALYYPPVIDYQKIKALQNSSGPLLTQDHGKLLDALDRVPPAQQDHYYQTLKATLLLNVGRADEAQSLTDQLLKSNAKDSDALALQAVIAISKNQHDKALTLAQQAVANNPRSGAAHLALSYVHQAQAKLDDAVKATRATIELEPENALAFARMAELQLSLGNRDEALKAAQQARNLNPKLARSLTVLGFAHLAQTDTRAAGQAFSEAIGLVRPTR